MPTFTEAQIMAVVSPVFWPFLRILAVFSSAPVFSSRSVPVRTRVALAMLLALCAQAGLPQQPVIGLTDPGAFGAVVQQVVVGLAIGLAVRIVFASVELAGELIGLQMGLNFAGFFDPSTNSQSSTVGRFFGNTTMLLFVVMGGHLMLLQAVVSSFATFPVGGGAMDAVQRMELQSDEIRVNSLHGQGLKTLGEGLEPLARAEDGLVEAIHAPSLSPFLFAVQWHPEWQAAKNPDSVKMFQAFGEAAEVLGLITAEVAAATGLPASTPVAVGIHDSNASLLPHLMAREGAFSVVSTGTWVVVMTVGGDPVTLDPARDTLVNVNAFGQPVPSARSCAWRTPKVWAS